MNVLELRRVLVDLAGGQPPRDYNVLAFSPKGFQFYHAHQIFRNLDISAVSGVLTLRYDPFSLNTVVLDQNVISVPFPSGIIPGSEYRLALIQDATGNRTIGGWSSNFLWAGGTAPTLTITANAVDLIVFYAIEVGGTTKLVGTPLLDVKT